MAKKLAYLVKYLRIYWTDFYKIHHMKALLVQMIEIYLIFLILGKIPRTPTDATCILCSIIRKRLAGAHLRTSGTTGPKSWRI